MSSRIDYLVHRLSLQPHPEGGFYAPAFRSEQQIETTSLNGNWKGPRSLYSSIFFLLTANHHSSWHRIASDEIWHLYEGDDICVHILHPDGTYSLERLSNKAGKEKFSAIVKAGCWFASHCEGALGYALSGCTLAPGFDFEDFELGNTQELIKVYPEYAKIIKKYAK